MPLRLEALTDRLTPAPIVAGVWSVDYAARYGFVGPVEDAFGYTGGVNWHAVAGLVGNGPRVVVSSLDSGAVISDFFAYEPEFRGGVVLESINDAPAGGDRLLIGAGPGGAPIVRQFDPLTGVENGPLMVFGDLDRDREGIGYLTAESDVAHAPRVWAMLGPGAGPVLVAADPGSGATFPPVFVGPAGDRSGDYRPAPAGFGVRGPDWTNHDLGVWVDGPAGPAATAWYDLQAIFRGRP